jgi:ribosomal protein S18 acetylase RimI-like enzyme
VAPDYRRQGLGRRMMAEVESRLRAKGCRKCYLHVLRGNADLVGFYERQGWSDMTPYVVIMGKELHDTE